MDFSSTNQLVQNELWVLAVCFFSISFAAGLLPFSFDKIEAKFLAQKFSIQNYLHPILLLILLSAGHFHLELAQKKASPNNFKEIKRNRTVATVDLSFLYTVIFMTGLFWRRLELKNEYIRKQENELYEASKQVSIMDMSANMVQEINNPLDQILLNATLSKKLISKQKITADEFSSKLDEIIKSVHEISTLVESAHNLPFENKPELNEEKINLEKCIQKTVDVCKERIKKLNIKIEYDMFGKIEFKTYRSQLVQVLLSLINNSIDAIQNQNEPWIKFVAKAEDSKVTISVIDSGTGISKRYREKIMLPFFSTKGIGKGKGLSLYHAKNILEKNKGTLYLDATSKNTKFIIELNAKLEDNSQTQIAA